MASCLAISANFSVPLALQWSTPKPSQAVQTCNMQLKSGNHQVRFLKMKRYLKTHRRTATLTTASAGNVDALRGLEVVEAASGELLDVSTLLSESGFCIVPFLTHFADLSSWEYGQQLRDGFLEFAESKGAKVVVIGLGSPDNAKAFANLNGFPLEYLYADPDGACFEALGFSKGFQPSFSLSPYAKLLTMLAGVGSPGTIQEVLRGYIGDRSSSQVFKNPGPFDILGTGYQRPFELATVRLLNMNSILPNWEALSPPNPELLTWQGGTLILEGGEVKYRYDDTGILKHPQLDVLKEALLSIVGSA